MRFIYYYTGTVNGEDALGHYVRSSFEVGSLLGALELSGRRLRLDVRHDDRRQGRGQQSTPPPGNPPPPPASSPRRDQGAARLPAQPMKTRRSTPRSATRS